ncbi:L-threonylcarbamoyladenylate synthase [Sneathia sp. DSM 16631]|uniref:L-threonylcarbamoyladenylate synthase n=1 Tax=Sneathia TaxID=168808 RepID=UPI001867B486|nr:L-threonylcarbamoyladenylate synthase [Sneathia sp. DSM 16631]MBE3030652.1 threonylcarbamoyl-AMP synthase [Sneathia sp. DSM 16631]
MNENKIEDGIKLLLEGRCIIVPTDTVYGLGAIPTKKAIEQLYLLKKRDKNKKILALVSDYNDFFKLTDDIDLNLIKHFLPGALSIVCKTKKEFVDLLGPTVGIRIPDNDLTRDIIRRVGGILMTTSANISGEPPVTNISNISDELLKNVPLIITTDKNLSGIPSTIVSYLDGKYSLIRQGQINFEEILKIGGETNENG